MRAFLTLGMVVEVADDDHLEEVRVSAEKNGWKHMIRAAEDVAEQHGIELTADDLDAAILYLGVQAWPLASFTERDSS